MPISKDTLRDLIYPGIDLHTRNRASLCRFWKSGPRDVLDAGCGNGYFSWLAYQSGATVVGLSYESGQIQKATEYLIGHRKADPRRLRFEQYNLYDLPKEARTFDEIICYEVLEHVRQDDLVVGEFFRLLRPGGILHLCCPHRLHLHHRTEILDVNESGGHVRRGYTEDEYRQLLQPLGFKINKVVGIGTPFVYHADRMLRAIRSRFGDVPALPLFLCVAPFVRFAQLGPPMPFSLYVRAVKPVASKQAGVS